MPWWRIYIAYLSWAFEKIRHVHTDSLEPYSCSLESILMGCLIAWNGNRLPDPCIRTLNPTSFSSFLIAPQHFILFLHYFRLPYNFCIILLLICILGCIWCCICHYHGTVYSMDLMRTRTFIAPWCKLHWTNLNLRRRTTIVVIWCMFLFPANA